MGHTGYTGDSIVNDKMKFLGILFLFLVLTPLMSFAEPQSTNKLSLNKTSIDAFLETDFCEDGTQPIKLLYSFAGNGKVRSMCSSSESRSILIHIDVFEEDYLKINIPKKLIHELGICNPKSLANSLLVYVDDEEKHQKLFTKKMDYDLIIHVTKDTKLVELLGIVNPVNPTLVCLSPKIQQDLIGSDNVLCPDDLIKIKKISDGSIACVTSETSSKIIARGWGEK